MAARIVLFASLVLASFVSTGPCAADPHTDYMLKCMGCHGPQGAEVVGKVPALKDNVARFLAVPGGRAYLVQVPGARQTPLDDRSVADLMNWLVRHFDGAHVPPDFRPYTEAEVHELRATRIDDVMATRARLLKRVETAGSAPAR